MTAPPARSSSPPGRTHTIARALGVASLGLGIAQLVAPSRFSRTVGARGGADRPGVVRFIGVREVAAGAGLLTQRRPTPFLWMRVAGDVMDLALLGLAGRQRGADRDRLSTATVSVLGIGATDLAAALGAMTGQDGILGAKPVRRSITIGREPRAIYELWRRLEQLPTFMRHLERVDEREGGRSHWVARAPFGGRVEWDAELVADEPARLIAWRSLPGSAVRHEGRVRFLPAPGGRGTEVHVELEYQPPLGPFGVALAKLAGEEPEQQVAEDLRRLKQILETGHVIRSEATVGGRRLRQRPAAPLDEAPPPIEGGPARPAGVPTRTSADGRDGWGSDDGMSTSGAMDGQPHPSDGTDAGLADPPIPTTVGGTR